MATPNLSSRTLVFFACLIVMNCTNGDNCTHTFGQSLLKGILGVALGCAWKETGVVV